MNSVFNTLITRLQCSWSPQVMPSRWFERKEFIRRYGYKDKICRRGTLPRLKDAKEVPMPTYKPKNAWAEKRALFGQNDYIGTYMASIAVGLASIAAVPPNLDVHPQNMKQLTNPFGNNHMELFTFLMLLGYTPKFDILGSGNLQPVRLLSNVPYWLRGFRGNEFQTLLRKRMFLQNRLRSKNPVKHNELQKRIDYLYKYLNRETNHHR